jgi:hypothetical protein
LITMIIPLANACLSNMKDLRYIGIFYLKLSPFFKNRTLIEELLEPKRNTGTFHVSHVAPTGLVVEPSTPCHLHILSSRAHLKATFLSF